MQNKLIIGILIVPVALIMLFTACHPTKSISKLLVKVNTAKDDTVDFSTFKTYNWYQEFPEEMAAIKPPYNTQLAVYIRQAIEVEMGKRGFTKSATNPDLLIAFDVSTPKSAEPASQTYHPGFGHSYSYMLGYRYAYGNQRIPDYKPVHQYYPNSLFIDMIEPQTNELIWRGFSENVIESYSFKRGTVQNLVDDILDKFAKTKK